MVDFRRGDDALFYLNTGTFGIPVWSMMKQVSDVDFDPQASDIEVKHRSLSVGHKHGEADPVFTATLIEDDSANVETLLAAAHSGAMVHIALSSLGIAVSGATYVDLESVVTGPTRAAQGEAAMHDLKFNKHANSANDIRRTTV